jgi:hypothetical protein
MKQIIILLSAFVVLFSACSSDHQKNSLINEAAAIPGSIRFSTAGLKMMTSFIDKRSGSMSVLYANQLAIENAAKKNAGLTTGERLVLVTWKQKIDPNWFGALVPGHLQSVEFVTLRTEDTAGLTTAYKIYVEGKLISQPDPKYVEERTKFVLDQQPSIIP